MKRLEYFSRESFRYSRKGLSCIGVRPTPIKKQFSGKRLSFERLKIAGASFRAVRSPEAPKITRIVGTGLLIAQVLVYAFGQQSFFHVYNLHDDWLENGNVFVMKNKRFKRPIHR